MNNTRFLVAIIPTIVILNLLLLAIVQLINWKNAYTPTSTEILKCVIFSVLTSLILLLLNNFKSIFRVSDHHVFNTHFQPIIKEFVKFIMISFIALHQMSNNSWILKLNVWQTIIILSVFTVFNFMEFVSDFMPHFYYKKYSSFLKFYDDFNYMENYDDGSKNDVTLKIVESLKRDNSVNSTNSDETLAEVLPKEITVTDMTPDVEFDRVYDSNASLPYGLGQLAHECQFPPHVTQPESFHFNHSVFSSPKFKPRKSSATLNHSQTSPKHINNYNSCYNLVDKLYSISPKNTFHLITASATAILKSDVTLQSDEVEEVLERQIEVSPFIENNEVVMQVVDTLDTNSVHTTDTHLSGGGGGNFKYKLPGGGKLKFGGGGGFDYDHRDGRKKDSTNSSVKSTRSLHFHEPERRTSHHEAIEHKHKWIGWLFPTKKKTNGIKKKLSKFTFSPRTNSLTNDCNSIRSSLLTYVPNDYQSIEEENQQCQDYFQVNKRDFTNYVNVSLGDGSSKIVFDPIFERFNYVTIRDLSSIEILLCFVNRLIWCLGSLLVYCAIYLNNSHNLLVGVIILKLFNVNMINKQRSSLINILLAKIMLNILALCIFIVL